MHEQPDVAPPVDRRNSERQAANVPVAILSDDFSIFAIVEDVSDAGARLLVREPVTAGTRVVLHVLLGTEVHPPVRAQAEVLRSHPRGGTGLYWSHEVAVQFLEQSGPWDRALSEVIERQADLRRTDA